MSLLSRVQQNGLAPAARKIAETPAYLRKVVLDAIVFVLGIIVDTEQKFSLTPDQLGVHVAVLGGSGAGKSKFLELLLRNCFLNGKAFGLWDPHGDLAKSLLAYVAALKASGLADNLWRKVHYLELTRGCVFSFDPVSRAPLRSVVGDYAYFQWLKTRVDRICKVMLRKVSEAEQDLMNRLKRWLKNVLYACLVACDGQNTHVGLDKALTFTDPDDPQFEMYFERVRDHLPREVALDFQKLIGTRRAIDREKWVESTINRLRDCLSPLTKLVYSQSAPSIDIKGIVERREFLLIDLKENGYFSQDEKVTIGGLLLMEVLSVKEAEEDLPEDERKEFIICVDEVGELLGDDLKRALGATRKFKCPIILGAQDLSTFSRGDFDMAAKVLTMCGTIVCFANKFKDDKEILADRVFCANLDLFTKRMVEVQRQRGDRFLKLDEVSENLGVSENWSDTETATESRTHAESIGQALAVAKTHSEGQAEAQGLSRKGMSGAPEMDVRTKSGARTETTGGAETNTNNSATTDTSGNSTSKATMNGGGTSRGVNVAHKNLVLPNIVSEFEDDGTLLAGQPELQRARQEQVIHTLGVGQAAVAVRGMKEAVIVQFDAVEEWWSNGWEKYEAISRMQLRIQELHPYFFQPPKRTLTVRPDDIDIPDPDLVVENGELVEDPVDNPYGN